MKKTAYAAYQNIEERGEYFVEGFEDKLSALLYLETEYPETKDMFTVEDIEDVDMSICLDCETYWVNDEGICGDCGEMRLSKRSHQAYYFRKSQP